MGGRSLETVESEKDVGYFFTSHLDLLCTVQWLLRELIWFLGNLAEG